MNYSAAFVRLPVVRESSGTRVSTPEDVVRVCADIANLAQESFHVLCLGTKHHLLNRHMVTLGLADASFVHAREVFRPAIADGASLVALAHNHPSGDPSPSAEDLRVTRQLVAAGKVLDVPVLDHVILGRRGGAVAHASIRELGLCDFQ